MEKKLEDHYNSLCGTIHRVIPDQHLSMEKCFINLSVVNHVTSPDDVFQQPEGQPIEKREYEELRDTFSRPRSFEEVHTYGGDFERILNVEEMYGGEGEQGGVQLPRRILLLGRAGIGKTTLCKNIVYKYINHRMWKQRFKYIVWIPLRILKQKYEPSTEVVLDKLYSSMFFEEDLHLGQELLEKSSEDESHVLYLLDGWDEIQDVMHHTEINNVLNIWQNHPYVLVTSRPYTYHADNFQNFDIVLETIGFSEENVPQYIRIVTGESEREKCANIIKFIQGNAGGVVAGLASVPILLDILICAWDSLANLDNAEREALTMTRLYSLLENYLWIQYMIKAEILTPEEVRNTNQYDKLEIYEILKTRGDGVNPVAMATVAQKILERNQIEFTAKEAMRYSNGDDGTATGFTSTSRIKSKKTHFLQCLNPLEEEEMDKTYVFTHLTFQEYFAALNLVNSLKSGHDLDDRLKYNPRYTLVWSFVAGLLAQEEQQQAVQLLNTLFNYFERDPIDQLGFAHQHLILNCLNECGNVLTEQCSVRAKRLEDELFHYIWAQYCCDGTSLYNGTQLPVGVLRRLVAQPDDWWEADSKRFTYTILRRQRHVPSDLLNEMLNELTSNGIDILRIDEQLQRKFTILKTQSNLGDSLITTIVDIISRIIESCSTFDVRTQSWKWVGNGFDKMTADKVEKWLSLLVNSRLSLSTTDMEALWSMCDRLLTCNRKPITNLVIGICLRHSQLPFTMIQAIVESNMKRRQNQGNRNRQPIPAEEMLEKIITDEKSYPLKELHLVLNQEALKLVLDQFLRPKIQACVDEGVLVDPRSLLRFLVAAVSSNRIPDGGTILRLFKMCGENLNLKLMLLLMIGNIREVQDDVREMIVSMTTLDEDFIDKLDDSSTGSIIKTSSVHKTLDFSYMLYLIPLLRFEFYDRHAHQAVRESFRKQRYFRPAEYTEALISTVASPIDVLKKSIGDLQFYFQLHQELGEHWNRIWSNIINTDQNQKQNFSSTLLLNDTNQFLHEYEKSVNPCNPTRVKFEIVIKNIMKEERGIDTQIFWTTVRKFHPLFVLGHHVFNDPYKPDFVKYDKQNWRQKFIQVIRKMFMEMAAVRALKDTSWGPRGQSHVEELLISSVPERNTNNMSFFLRILEHKTLASRTINTLVHSLRDTDEYSAKLIAGVLSRQEVGQNNESVIKLQEYLLGTNSAIARHVALTFQMNPMLLNLNGAKERIHNIIRAENFHESDRLIRMIAIQVLLHTQLNEEILLRIVPIFKECLSHIGIIDNDRTMVFCMSLLLTQNKLPVKVFADLVACFHDMDLHDLGYLYFWFLESCRVPLPPFVLQHLFKLVKENHFKHASELSTKTHEPTRTALQLRSILKRQPLWRLLANEFTDSTLLPYRHKSDAKIELKVELILEKIIQDPNPMAIFKYNGQFVYFSPTQSELKPLVGFRSNALSIETVKYLHERPGLDLRIPEPLDMLTRYFRFHTAEENLEKILEINPTRTEETETWNGCKLELNESNVYYVKATRIPVATTDSGKTVFIDSIVNQLKIQLAHEHCKLRHFDLRSLYLTDDDLHLLIPSVFLKSCPKLGSLILSDNKITAHGLDALSKYKLQIEYLFLDRNRIHLNVAQFSTILPAMIKNGTQCIDISMNYISASTEFGLMRTLISQKLEISTVQAANMKDAIQCSRFLNSQDLKAPNLHQSKFDPVVCLRDSEYGNIKPVNISKDEGCIFTAEKIAQGFIGRVLFNRGHAFMGIEWIPDPTYGQKQLVIADLRKYIHHNDQLRIRLEEEFNPLEMLENLSKTRDKSRGKVMLVKNEDISKIVESIQKSKNRARMFSYFVLASNSVTTRFGLYNCFSWTDSILSSIGHEVNSMLESIIRLSLILLIIIIAIVTIVYQIL